MEKFTLLDYPVNATTNPFCSTLTAFPSPLTVFAHGTQINLFEEMSGSEMTLRKITNYSLATGGTVIVGCTLAYSGVKRLSAVIAHNGELVDIVDACSVSPPYTPAGIVKIFKSDLSFALLVGGDVRVNFIMQKLKKVPDNEKELNILNNIKKMINAKIDDVIVSIKDIEECVGVLSKIISRAINKVLGVALNDN
jgi:hypothetical protein